MGKITGFLEYPRARRRTRRPVARAAQGLARVRAARSMPTRARDAGRALHGLRHSVLSQGLSARQHHPRLERPRVPRPLAGGARRLHSTNNFPEFTGRVCPAPCEAACVLGINDEPVTIKHIERQIIDRAFEEGWVSRQPRRARPASASPSSAPGPRASPARSSWRAPARRRPCSSATTASAACCATASRLQDGEAGDRRAHRADGGRRRHVPHRRRRRRRHHDGASCAASSTRSCSRRRRRSARDLPIPGRELKGVHFAMEFLTQQNQRVRGRHGARDQIMATGKRVIILGGGDTGADCLGTSNRQGAKSVHQFELMPQPPDDAHRRHAVAVLADDHCAPAARTKRACERDFSISTKQLQRRANGNVEAAARACARVEADDNGRSRWSACRAASSTLDADLVLLAMGFIGPEKAAARRARRRADRARQRQGRHGDYATSDAGRVRLRRHAPRPVAGGLGDLGRP